MDVSLHRAAREGNMALLMSVLRVTVDNPPTDLTRCLTPQKNTALHIAAAFGHDQIMLELIKREPSLISQPNSSGDTPLHVAAKLGNYTSYRIFCFLKPTVEEGLDLWRKALRMKNLDGYTPIHVALRKRHDEVALLFMEVAGDIEATDDVSGSGESLLYLASEAGLLPVVRSICRRDRSSTFSTRGPGRQNPLHIAVITGNYDIVTDLMRHFPDLIKEADGFGKTALHYASTIGNYDDDGRRIKILEVLIKADPSLAYKSDNDGNYPLLIATLKAPFAAIEIILEHCPDSAELVARNGQNAFHLAVMNNRESTLGSLIKRPEFKMQINQPDKGGNTPMHLATQNNFDKIAELLLTCEGLDLTPTNQHGFTAMDICGYTPNQRLIHDKLKGHGAVPSRQRWEEMLLMPPPPPPSPSPQAPDH